MKINKTNGYLISGIFILTLTLITLFLIFLFMHPKVYFSKASGFSQHDGIKAGKNKLRFVVPETVDPTKSTFIHVRQEWFTTNRLGRITAIKAKPNKYLALDFADKEYNSEVFTIYTKNWFGITREHDVIVDYSNFLRVFFPVPTEGETARRPIILPYSKLQTTYKHIYEELLKINSFYTFDEGGKASKESVSKDTVFIKENARGRAFIVNNNSHISLIYDFLLSGIFKNQTQKTQVYELIDKTVDETKTYDPEKQGLEIKFNTPPFYISKFLGWYYIDPSGNRVDLKPGQEFQIPKWVQSELRLIARYDITTDVGKIGPELDKQGLVAVSYFDGVERIFFDIVKKGSPFKEHIYQKPGYTYEGWYKDSSLTQKLDFTNEVANTHTVLYLKSIKQNQPQPEKPIKYHTINFITPVDANQLMPTKRAHGQKLETNYLTPSLVSRLDEYGNLWELEYWNLVDPVTGARTRFDFNTPITEDITLEVVMRKRVAPKTKYTIKRYYESVDQAGKFIEDKTKKEVVDGQTPWQEVELSPTQTNAPYGFTLDKLSVLKKKIKADGTTVFELKYKRNRYTVNFEVNYNGNHFKDVNASATPDQTIAYEGKLTKPANPTITKSGYTYTFKHWQLKDEMGSVYREVSEFDFANTQITKNTTLVAYFQETIDRVAYKVVHYLEKTGKDAVLNGQYERIEEVKTGQKVEDGAVYQDYASLNGLLYEKHTNHPQNKLNAQLTAGDNSVEVCQYYKLKEVEVRYKKTEGIASFTYDTSKVKKTRTVTLPGYTLKNTHNFVGWALTANGQTQSEFVVEKTTNSLEIFARTDYQNRDITYTIRKEKPDGSFDETEEKNTGKIASTHTVSYANPDSSVFQDPTYNPANLLVNADKNQNKVVVTLIRKTYQVTFEVKNFLGSVATRTIRHGAKIGAIDESQFAAQGLGIRKAELDGKEKTKEEIENFVVQKTYNVTLHIGIPIKKLGKYPQTRVDNPAGIHHLKDEVHELKFNSKDKEYTMQFTRSYWQDSEDNKYEKYGDLYFKIEPVDFVKIPKQNTWFTEKIIDFSPFNIHYYGYPDNAKPERSIFKAMVEDIGKVIGSDVHMPTYDSSDFGIVPALSASLQSKLKKESTDYAKAILSRHHNQHVNYYRGIDMLSFYESGAYGPYYNLYDHQCWWLATQYLSSPNPDLHRICYNGNPELVSVCRVLGVVVCIR